MLSHTYQLILVWFIFEALTAVVVAYDARRLGQNAWLWGILSFVTWPVGPLIWVVLRVLRTSRPRR